MKWEMVEVTPLCWWPGSNVKFWQWIKIPAHKLNTLICEYGMTGSTIK